MKITLRNLLTSNRLVPIFLLSLILLLLYGSLLSGDSALYYRDVLHNYYPHIEFQKKSLWNGDWPFWNPLLFNGTPLMAGLEPPLFYPLAWMFFLLPFQIALGLNLCLHHLFAAIGVYLLGREYRWSILAAGVACLSFSLGGVMLSMNNLHPLQNSIAWIPVLIFLAHRICERQSISTLVWFSLVYGLQILSGHLEIVLLTSLMILFYTMIFLRQQGLRLAGWMVLALGLGILLGALQLFPSLAYSPWSVRKDGLLAAETMLWSYHPLLSYSFLLPENSVSVFQGVSLSILFGEKIFGQGLLFVSTYMGLFAWFGVALLCLRLKNFWKNGFVFFWGVMLILSLLLAFGHYLPLGHAAAQFSVLSYFRYPSKFLVLTSLAFSILAGWGFNEVEQNPETSRKFLGVTVGFLGLFCVCALLLSVFRSSVQSLLSEQIMAIQHLTQEQAAQWGHKTLQQIMLQINKQALICLATLAFTWLCLRSETKRIYLPFILLVCACLDLSSSGINTLWLASSDIMVAKSSAAVHLREKELQSRPFERFIVPDELNTIPRTFRPDILNTGVFRSTLYLVDAMSDNFGLLEGFRSSLGSWPARTYLSEQFKRFYNESLQTGGLTFRNTLESQSGVRYVLLQNPELSLLGLYQSSDAYRLSSRIAETNVYIFENLNWLPRVRFHYQSANLTDQKNILAVFSSPESYGFKLKEQLILFDDKALKTAQEQIPSQEAKVKRWTQPEIISEKNQKIELAFETNTSGYLVLADQYIPGWKAYDNNVETPILRANLFHRAVRVAPGQHRIRFEYQPPGFLVGLIVTGISILIWLILLFLSLKQVRQKPRIETVKLEEVVNGG